MDELIARIDQLIAEVSVSKAVKVTSTSVKQTAIELGKYYFQTCRAPLINAIPADRLATVDESWQQLVRLGHGRSLRASYAKRLASLKKAMTELHIIAISNPPQSLGTHGFTANESVLIRTLEGLVPSAASSYIQGILDLASPQERSSYRGTACEFREAFREILDHLAPDDELMKGPGFAPEKDQKKPTMKQKVKFILKSRGMKKTQSKVAEKSLELIETLCGDVARAIYDRASLSTHLETTRDEVFQLKRYVDTMFFDLLAIRK